MQNKLQGLTWIFLKHERGEHSFCSWQLFDVGLFIFQLCLCSLNYARWENMHPLPQVATATRRPFGVNYRWTAGIYLEASVRVRGSRDTERTCGLQSAKQTLSGCLSFDLELTAVNPLLGPAQGYTLQSSTLYNLSMPFGSPVPDESAFTSNIAMFCLWHSNRVPFCSLNMSRHGNKIEEKHPVHPVRNNRIWPWEIPTLGWKDKKKASRAGRGFTGSECRLPFWYVELRFSNHRLWNISVTYMIWTDFPVPMRCRKEFLGK